MLQFLQRVAIMNPEVIIMSKLNRIAPTSQRLQEAMAIANIRQADLANMTGISKSVISRYCSGGYEPKLGAIKKLASALGVTEMWLWGYDVSTERTDVQKKNDQQLKLVARIRKDERFAKAVAMLDQLSQDQFDSIEQILSAFTQK